MLTTKQVTEAATERAIFWSPRWCPPRVLRRLATDAQRQVHAEALKWDARYLAQRFHLFVALSNDNRVGTAGPTVGAFGMDGQTVATEGATGQAQGFDLSVATLLLPPMVIASATVNTVTVAGASWTTNAYLGRLLVVIAGPGAIQYRRILSNTATTFTLTANLTGTLGPTSMIAVYDAPDTVRSDTGVVLTMPARRQAIGYVTKLDAQGNAYLDLTQPMVGQYRAPIQLPPLQRLLSARRWTTNPVEEPVPVSLLPSTSVDLPIPGIALAVVGDTLVPMGDATMWAQVRSVEVGYVPVLPALAGDDPLVLGDQWETAIVTAIARGIAQRGVMGNFCAERAYTDLHKEAAIELDRALGVVRKDGYAELRYEVQAL